MYTYILWCVGQMIFFRSVGQMMCRTNDVPPLCRTNSCWTNDCWTNDMPIFHPIHESHGIIDCINQEVLTILFPPNFLLLTIHVLWKWSCVYALLQTYVQELFNNIIIFYLIHFSNLFSEPSKTKVLERTQGTHWTWQKEKVK